MPFWPDRLLVQCHLLDIVAAEAISDFSLKKDAHVTDLAFLMLVVITLISG